MAYGGRLENFKTKLRAGSDCFKIGGFTSNTDG
jgi:hypothetical protein